MLERGLVFDAMHHVVRMDEKPGKLGRPVVGELVGHATVHGLHLAGKLVVVVLLVAERPQEVPDRLGVVGAVLPQVVANPLVQCLLPVALDRKRT